MSTVPQTLRGVRSLEARDLKRRQREQRQIAAAAAARAETCARIMPHAAPANRLKAVLAEAEAQDANRRLLSLAIQNGGNRRSYLPKRTMNRPVR